MRKNDRTNKLIMWLVIAGDFVLLNTVTYVFIMHSTRMALWGWGEQLRMFFIISNLSMLLSEWKFHTIIHERLVSAGEVLRSTVLLTLTQTAIAYVMMRHLMYWIAVGKVLLGIGLVLFILLVILRFVERIAIKNMRKMGRNSRSVTLVGSDRELWKVYEQLLLDPTTGYRIQGYYADTQLMDARVPWLGTIRKLVEGNGNSGSLLLGDEMYVCLSRKEGQTIKALSQLCDSQVTKFYYVPVSVESIGLNMKREFINDIEIYTTHESPLGNPMNQFVKRGFDIVISVFALIGIAIIFPFVYIIIKVQSPGPIFFKQLRTGMNGRDFMCYKFRSMYVNNDADKLQATKNDPRKYPFGDFMRKTNMDELPQFWNVLKGDMSVVGPRPHMLAHTNMYSQQIAEYMVRHFVKPGITGWAQVTGFRGETKDLWQMEERVRRDIWYMEHWSIWLDIRIVWRTIKTIFAKDQNAY